MVLVSDSPVPQTAKTKMRSGYANGARVPVVEPEMYDHGPVPDDIEPEELEGENEEFDEHTHKIARAIACGMCADILRQILQVILEASDRGFACDILASTFGLAVREGKSDADLARHYGVSRQDILNAKKRMQEKIGVKFITRRSKQGTTIYAKSNHRHAKAW